MNQIHFLKYTGFDTKFLLFASFLIPFSSFAFLPFLTIILDAKTEMSFRHIGVLLSIMTIIQYCGGFVSGFIVQMTNQRFVMLLALALRCSGFLLWNFYQAGFLWVSLVLVAAGSSLYLPANKSYLVGRIAKQHRSFFLSLSNVALNMGMVLGTMLGGIFALHYTYWVTNIISLLFLSLFAAHIFCIQKLPQKQPGKKDSKIQYQSILKKIIPVFGVNAIIFYMYFFFQNYAGVYIKHYHTVQIYSYLMIFSSLIIIVFQPMLSGFISKAKFHYIILLSMLLFLASFILLAQIRLVYLVASVVLISFGELLSTLKTDLQMVEQLPRRTALAFSYTRFSSGLGAASSGWIGGYLFAHYQKNDILPHFWLNIAAQCAIIIFVMILLKRIICKKAGLETIA